MVLISVKIHGNKAYVVLIPIQPLNNMLESHVDRIFKSGDKTCFVKFKNNWEEKPSYPEIIQLLLNTIKYNRILQEGEYSYPIQYPLELRCRDFNAFGEPESSIFEGDFRIMLVRIKGGALLIRKTLAPYEKINNEEYTKIENTLKNLKEKEVLIYYLHHIHPTKPKHFFRF